MFSTLVRNTVVTATGYLAVALLNLLLVPVIIAGYGLHDYGLIVLARVFLPTGFMALFDLGVSETGTLVVARARAMPGWERTAGQITLLFLTSLACGVTIGAALVTLGPQLSAWFHVDAGSREAFIRLIRVTGIALIVLYPGLLLEGVVKGYERYGLLRFVEVLTAVAYAAGTVAVIRAGYSYAAVAYVFLLVNVLKYAALVAFAIPHMKRTRLRAAWPDADARAEMWQRSMLMFQNKILGAFQAQAPPLFVGLLVGPVGAGVYDVLTRVPRAAKSVFSLLNSALLPVSARLDQSGDQRRLRLLGGAGFWLVPAITFPALIGAAVFSRELLQVWLGPALVHFWPWLALMFLVPLLSTFLSFGQTMMQVRSTFLAKNNRLAFGQITLQFVASLALVRVFQERAFIAGQVAATILFFPFQMQLLLREQGFETGRIWRVLGRQAAVAIPLALVAAVAKRYELTGAALPFAISLALWCAAYWVSAYALALSASERMVVRKVITAALGR
jgi:O-antigen/teichoic acid export membrane protein